MSSSSRPPDRDRGAEPPEPPRDESRGTDAEVRCDLCGGPVLDRHCKVVCLNCGYQRDCSDP